jgi:hypothetical protein
MKKASTRNIAINIYSESKLIHETLKQVYECGQINTVALAQFGLAEPQNILIVDLTHETEKELKLYARFSSLCPTILLVSNSVTVQGAIVLCAPVRLSELLDAIEQQPVGIVQPISRGVFINMRTLCLLKVSSTKVEEIKLTRSESNILKRLAAARRHKAVTEKEILEAVFGYSSAATTNTVKTHICRLRQKIGKELVKSTDEGYELGV